jgi:hypothetical protein
MSLLAVALSVEATSSAGLARSGNPVLHRARAKAKYAVQVVLLASEQVKWVLGETRA